MNIQKLCRYLAKANATLAILICMLASWGLYALAPNPVAGVIIGALGAFIFAINYALWPLAGALVAQRRKLAASLPIATSLLISILVIWSIHGVIDRGIRQQQTAAEHAALRYQDDDRQLQADRALYTELLASAPAVVSQERQALQATIAKLQAESSAKRAQKYDRPADRIDESVIALQGKLGELVRLDADAADRQSQARHTQAAELLSSIKAREASLSNRTVAVAVGITPREISALAFLAEFVCASVFFTIGLVGRSEQSRAVGDVDQAPESERDIAPAVPFVIDSRDAVVTDPAPVASPLIGASEALQEHAVLAPVPTEEVEGERREPLFDLKPVEAERYKVFLARIQGLPADQPIPVDQQATDLGFGKVLVSTFFKLAGEEGVIEKRGRQWFLAVTS